VKKTTVLNEIIHLKKWANWAWTTEPLSHSTA